MKSTKELAKETEVQTLSFVGFRQCFSTYYVVSTFIGAIVIFYTNKLPVRFVNALYLSASAITGSGK